MGVDGAAPRRNTEWKRALVVFCDTTELWWLRFLRHGFRHCFVALGDGRSWITIDPLSHRTDIAAHPVHAGHDLAAIYRSHGLTVVETYLREAPLRPAPWRPFTCVEAVKRVLGLHEPWLLTPWQLHRFLIGLSPKSQRRGSRPGCHQSLGQGSVAAASESGWCRSFGPSPKSPIGTTSCRWTRKPSPSPAP